MMQELFIMVGVVVGLLVIQLYLRYKVKKQKEERENRKFGE